jgi:hypothetical protein
MAMRSALWRRALKVYAIHIALLLFLLWLLVPIAVARGAHAITDLASFYIQHPQTALAGGLLLAYNPPLLDILPMYVIFLVLSPWLLEHGLSRGWGGLIAASAALWLFAQHGGPRHVYESAAAIVGWPVPYSQTGAFSLLAWQLLWLIGLRVGALKATAGAPATYASWRPFVLHYGERSESRAPHANGCPAALVPNRGKSIRPGTRPRAFATVHTQSRKSVK